MKFSIIVPTYNSAKTIMDTLRSIMEQEYFPLEVIVIDGNSKDNTVQLVQDLTPEAILISEKDNGIYDAMNKGIAMATGDVIGILNSDDFYAHSEVLFKVAKQLKNTKADSLFANLYYVDEFEPSKIVRRWYAKSFKRSKFLFGWMPPHPTFFVKKSVYDRFGSFRTDLKISADYELMLRLLYKEEISTTYLREVIVHMRTGGQSNASIANRLKANMEDRKAWTMNGLTPNPLTLLLKPLRKLGQFFS